MQGENNHSFWPSYVDIMTTLFAIMLVLFAVSYSRFKIKEGQLEKKKEQMGELVCEYKSLVDEYENIITVYSTVGAIDSTEYFKYDEQYLKHLMHIQVEYQSKEYRIDKLNLDLTNKEKADQIRNKILDAGSVVKNTLDRLEHNDSVKNNIKFLVVIEGQSSRVAFNESDWRNNYTLSYLRAQYLNKFWKDNDIDFEKNPRCEVIISGSGEGGHPRVIPNEELLHQLYLDHAEFVRKWAEEEKKNQRFLVHIVPVIGNIDVTKEKIDNLKGKAGYEQ